MVSIIAQLLSSIDCGFLNYDYVFGFAVELVYVFDACACINACEFANGQLPKRKRKRQHRDMIENVDNLIKSDRDNRACFSFYMPSAAAIEHTLTHTHTKSQPLIFNCISRFRWQRNGNWVRLYFSLYYDFNRVCTMYNVNFEKNREYLNLSLFPSVSLSRLLLSAQKMHTKSRSRRRVNCWRE